MRRGLTIGLVVTACALPAPAQLRSITGELQYQHQYQDFLSGTTLSTQLRRSPRLSLTAAGDILAPQLATFNLRTALAYDFGDGGTGEYRISTRQLMWDSYDVNLAFFQYSPVKVNLSLRDNLLKTRSATGLSETFTTSVRRQEERFSASTYKLAALPSTTIGYERTRSFSTIGEPFDQVVQRTSLGMSTANGSTSISVSGGISRLSERWSGFQSTFTDIQFDATKDFSEENRLEITADYNRYDDYGTLGANAGFSGVIGDGMRVFSSLFGRNSTSKVSTYLAYGLSGGVQVTADEHWQYGGAMSGRSGYETRTLGETTVRERTFDWSGNASLQHSRRLGTVQMQNSLGVNYVEQSIRGRRRGLAGSLANGFSTSFGAVTLSAGYGLTGGVTTNGATRYSVGNVANVMLNGQLENRLQFQSAFNYNDERYTGDIGFFQNRRTIMLREGLTMPGVFVIPYSIGAGASVTWYFAYLTGRAYGWYASFTSGAFFLQGLSAQYRYNRTYDPYYLSESVEHTAELRYQWRALLFELRAREYRLKDRRREIWFSMARPFAL